jgi:hypothetical protein
VVERNLFWLQVFEVAIDKARAQLTGVESQVLEAEEKVSLLQHTLRIKEETKKKKLAKYTQLT